MKLVASTYPSQGSHILKVLTRSILVVLVVPDSFVTVSYGPQDVGMLRSAQCTAGSSLYLLRYYAQDAKNSTHCIALYYRY